MKLPFPMPVNEHLADLKKNIPPDYTDIAAVNNFNAHMRKRRAQQPVLVRGVCVR